SREPPIRCAARPVHSEASSRRSRLRAPPSPMRRHGIVADVPTAVKTTVTELGDSRVRVQVEIPAGEVEQRLERKATQLGREMKLPGFRRGKVPAPLVLQRVGRETVLEEAVRDSLPGWYSAAIVASGIVPVGHPQLRLAQLPPQAHALEFTIEIG